MIEPDRDDPVAGVDALVAALAPGVCVPAARHREVVLVAGPWLAGVSAVVAALREQLPDCTVVEQLTAGDAPTAVVFVVSAAATLTDSDCALLDTVATGTDAVIGVVSKIDVHRQWPRMLAAARDKLAGYAPRYRGARWVAVAAAPDLGAPRVDDLVAELRRQLDQPAIRRRNRLREWESVLRAAVRRHRRDAEAAGRRDRMADLQEQRGSTLRQRRVSKSELTIATRGRIAQARVQLSHFARNRCSSVRAELAGDAASMTRRRLPGFVAYVRSRIGEVVVEVDQGVSEHLTDAAHQLGLPVGPSRSVAPLPNIAVGEPLLASRRLETQLMTVLGVGFGLGVALTLSRLFTDLTAGLTAAGAAICAVAGLAVAAWMVGTRRLLHDRAALDRWVVEVCSALRAGVEELVALRVLSAESAWASTLAEHDEAEGTRVAGRIAELDGELRGYAAAAARAEAVRDREMPALLQAMAAVRAELDTPGVSPQ